MLDQSALQDRVFSSEDPLPNNLALTPTECTMHFGVPVVPEEYMMKSGWLKGTCSKVRAEPEYAFTKSSYRTLGKELVMT